MLKWPICLLILVFLAAPMTAWADPSLEATVGYSHLWLSRSGAPFDTRDGVRTEVRGVFTPCGDIPNLRLGLGIGVSGYSHDLPDHTTIEGEFFHHPEQDLSFIEPEIQLSWRQFLDRDDHWFVEPGLGVGALIGHYGVEERHFWDDTHVHNDWSGTIEGRPFLRGGYQLDRWTFAGELSCAFGGKLNFSDNIHGDVTELYIGFLLGYRF